MKPFRARNPVPIGLIAVGFFLVLAVLAFKAQDLPVFNGGGHIYKAAFTEVANLQKNNEVRIAGVKVGKVQKLELEGNHVLVRFQVKSGVHLGSLTRASIKIKTLVGEEFLALDPEGNGNLDPDVEIPTTRTTPPFDVIPAFQQLAQTEQGIDTQQLARALNTLADDFSDTAPNVHTALTGLSRLSHTIADRDSELRELLGHASNVTGVLANRDKTLQQLIVDANSVMQMLDARRQVITQLLQNTVALSNQLNGLVAEQRSQLGPALQNLKGVIDTLNANQASIYRTLQLVGPFIRMFTNTLGNGQWFDTYVSNLGPFPVSPALPPGVPSSLLQSLIPTPGGSG